MSTIKGLLNSNFKKPIDWNWTVMDDLHDQMIVRRQNLAISSQFIYSNLP